MYDPTIGIWLQEDPIGFEAGDMNLRRYVGNNPTNNTDPSGLVHLPSSSRGQWIRGTPGDGVFVYWDIPINRERGLVGLEVRFRGGYIAPGGFPAHYYWGGNPANCTVGIPVVHGDRRDMDAADAAFRRLTRNPNWERPDGWTWNHAGPPGATTMELVDERVHRAIAHSGNAGPSRAQARITRASRTPRLGALGALDLYLTLRDACQAAGVLQPEYHIAVWEDYHFVAPDNSVFVVQPRQIGLWPVGTTPRRVFIAGPRAGQTESLSDREVEDYRREGQAKYGRYIPGGLFREPRFIPGTHRRQLPIYNDWNQETGYIDENGVHRYSRPFLPPNI